MKKLIRRSRYGIKGASGQDKMNVILRHLTSGKAGSAQSSPRYTRGTGAGVDEDPCEDDGMASADRLGAPQHTVPPRPPLPSL